MNEGNLLELLAEVFNVSSEKTFIQKVRDALRRYESRRNNEIFLRTMKSVGDKLEYDSSKYLAMFFNGIIADGFYTLKEQYDEFIQSPFAQSRIERILGRKGTALEFIVELALRRKPLEEQMNIIKMEKKVEEALKRMENYIHTIADYCQSSGKSPDEVLGSDEDRLEIILSVYGSLDSYEREQNEVSAVRRESIKSLKELEELPVGFAIREFLLSKNLDPENMGIRIHKLGETIRDYIRDYVAFVEAYSIEEEKYRAEEINRYRALLDGQK